VILDLSQAKLRNASSYLEEEPAPETRDFDSLPASGGTSLDRLAGLRCGAGSPDARRPGWTAATLRSS
jgi:hypothetical protein